MFSSARSSADADEGTLSSSSDLARGVCARSLSRGGFMISRWRGHRRASLLAIALVAAVGTVGALAATAVGKSSATTITIIEHQPPRVALLKKMLPLFERTHPNIKVKLI